MYGKKNSKSANKSLSLRILQKQESQKTKEKNLGISTLVMKKETNQVIVEEDLLVRMKIFPTTVIGREHLINQKKKRKNMRKVDIKMIVSRKEGKRDTTREMKDNHG